MNLENLTGDDLVKIVALYEEHCGSGRTYGEATSNRATPVMVLEKLRKKRVFEYKVGSRWGEKSTLTIMSVLGRLEVSFDPKFSPEERRSPKYQEAQEAASRFKQEAMRYLEKYRGPV